MRVHSLPSFASCWLVPRLARFFAANPKIEVEITSVGDPARPPDLAGLGVDFAIRVGISEHGWPDAKVEKLVHEDMFPVCAPDLLKGPVPLQSPRDLSRHTLMHVSRRAEGWPEWLAAAKAQGLADCDIDPNRGPKFDTIQMSITAATQGIGVAMGRLPLVEDYLKSGSLIAPFPLRVKSRNAYWLLSAPNAPLSKEAATFRDWLKHELASEDAAEAFGA
ncbi:MAG TPA: LysR substrate-binding domain-containing protein [Rhizomicrobium sp.]|nr:LysR substrate-binding domain-containing protein [Rhizomicrobium sp.]